MTEQSNSDNSEWLCLTPHCDENGSPLTFEQRLAHAAQVIGAQNVKAFDATFAQLERCDMTPTQRVQAMRCVVEHMKAATTTLLTRIAHELLEDHNWLDARESQMANE